MRETDQWLRDRLARTGLGYTENGKRKTAKQAVEKKAESAKQVARRKHYKQSPDGVHQVQIKPLSVNKAWKGRRFKTDDYTNYEQACAILLPESIEIPEGALEVFFEWGVSSKGADYDNPVKPFQDILQARYGFDDRRIVAAHISKVLVKQGDEYIKFKIVEASMKSIFEYGQGSGS